MGDCVGGDHVEYAISKDLPVRVVQIDGAPGDAPEINANGNILGHYNKDLPDDYESRGLADGSIVLSLNEEGISMHIAINTKTRRLAATQVTRVSF